MSAIQVRKATAVDLPRLGAMGAALAKLHHDFDPPRFMYEGGMEEGYAWWLGKEMKKQDAVVLVAEQAGSVVGYAYGRLEERDWSSFLDAHGGFHDLWIDPAARAHGAGSALALATIDALTALGAPRIVLKTASANAAAQRLFAKLGWRPTMVEMTREPR